MASSTSPQVAAVLLDAVCTGFNSGRSDGETRDFAYAQDYVKQHWNVRLLALSLRTECFGASLRVRRRLLRPDKDSNHAYLPASFCPFSPNGLHDLARPLSLLLQYVWCLS